MQDNISPSGVNKIARDIIIEKTKDIEFYNHKDRRDKDNSEKEHNDKQRERLEIEIEVLNILIDKYNGGLMNYA